MNARVPGVDHSYDLDGIAPVTRVARDEQRNSTVEAAPSGASPRLLAW